jgi:hypothetical protein
MVQEMLSGSYQLTYGDDVKFVINIRQICVCLSSDYTSRSRSVVLDAQQAS